MYFKASFSETSTVWVLFNAQGGITFFKVGCQYRATKFCF